MLLQNPTGFWTLWRRESDRFLKIWLQTLVSPILSNLLFLGVFGGLFAARAGENAGSYLTFIVPGLCAMGTISSAFSNPSFSLMLQKYQGFIQDLNMIPLSEIEKTMAITLAGTLRGILVGVLTYLSALPFIGWHMAHPLLFVTTLFLLATVFSSLGLTLGLSAKSFDGLNFALTIVITPLLFLGGVFFEVTKLPGFLATIAPWNPAFPLINIVRYSVTGISEGPLAVHLVLATALAAASLTIAYTCMRRGVGLRS